MLRSDLHDSMLLANADAGKQPKSYSEEALPEFSPMPWYEPSQLQLSPF